MKLRVTLRRGRAAGEAKQALRVLDVPHLLRTQAEQRAHVPGRPLRTRQAKRTLLRPSLRLGLKRPLAPNGRRRQAIHAFAMENSWIRPA